jgi:hypothetical protein
MSKPKNQMRYLNVDRYLLTKKAFLMTTFKNLKTKYKVS